MSESPPELHRRPSHVFVVGVHRSGTTLMRRILNDSPSVAICAETHFMGHLVPALGMRNYFKRFAPLSIDANVERLVDHMQTPAFRKFSFLKELSWQWIWFTENVTPEELRDAIIATDRSDAAIFDCFMRLFADSLGASVRGDKTPIHLHWAEELLGWYPKARILHMVRDPRAVHVSDLRRRLIQKNRTPIYSFLRRLGPAFELFTAVETTLFYFASQRAAARLSSRFPDRYLQVVFEELVQHPREVITRLCEDSGLVFDERMLDRVVVSAGYNVGDSGFDSRASDRWKAHISGWASAWYSWFFREDLCRFERTTSVANSLPPTIGQGDSFEPPQR